MTRETVAVAVPVYKPEMSGLSCLSLSRCVAVLGNHPLVFFGPRSLNYAPYRRLAPSAEVAVFDDRFFTSLGGYSELLVRPAFYQAFAAYRFMLIYQLDAFVFQDQLLEWCGRDWDYIGAPWREDSGRWMGVGNGGFCLRKVGACLDVLHSRHKVDPHVYWEHVRRTTPSPVVRALKYHRKVLAHLGICSDIQSFLRKWVRREEPEDMFWGLHAIRYHPSWRVAPVTEAQRFAVEACLPELAPLFRDRPPFGCHRGWFLEMLQRYLSSDAEPRDDYEGLVGASLVSPGRECATNRALAGKA